MERKIFSRPLRKAHAYVAAFVLSSPLVLAAIALGCSDDDAATRDLSDAGIGRRLPEGSTSTTTNAPDVTVSEDAGRKPVTEEMIARGRYLVDTIGICGECHTPRLPSGMRDPARYLAGVECLRREGDGCLHSANLTDHATGLQAYTDDQIKAMFTTGKRPDGRNLHPVMPYWVYRNMTDDDADAIVAYLRTVPGVDHVVPQNDPPFDNVPVAAQPIEPGTIPAARDGDATAERGRYLATMAGLCLACHTPELPAGAVRPIDMSKPFAGNRPFPDVTVGGGAPVTVYSANITSQLVAGIGGWSVDDIKTALKLGRDKTGSGICPPMPSGPTGAYGALSDSDAHAIAVYIQGVPAINERTSGTCTGP